MAPGWPTKTSGKATFSKMGASELLWRRYRRSYSFVSSPTASITSALISVVLLPSIAEEGAIDGNLLRHVQHDNAHRPSRQPNDAGHVVRRIPRGTFAGDAGFQLASEHRRKDGNRGVHERLNKLGIHRLPSLPDSAARGQLSDEPPTRDKTLRKMDALWSHVEPHASQAL